jgi:hypothetical protein
MLLIEGPPWVFPASRQFQHNGTKENYSLASFVPAQWMKRGL